MEQQKRIDFLDIAKGIAIILVVIGHAIQFGSGSSYYASELYLDDLLYKIIYSFHMPFFMLISGYLYYFSVKKHSAKDIIISRIKSLLIPIFVYATLKFILKAINGELVFGLSLVREYASTVIGTLWFLWAVFYCSLLVFIIHKLFKDSICAYLICFAASFFIPDTYGLSLYKFMNPFYVAGYLYNKYDLKEKLYKKLNKPILLTALGIVFVVMMLFFNRESYIYTTAHFILKSGMLKQLGIDIYRMMIGFVGSALVLVILQLLSSKLAGTKLFKGIVFLGKRTFGLYVISSFVFSWALLPLTTWMFGMNVFIMLVESALIIAVSLAIMFILRKNKITGLLFLGEK